MNEFGKEVKKVCIDMNITQRSIAEAIGISENGLSNALNRSNVGLQQMRKIADAMNCDLEIKLKPKTSKFTSPVTHGIIVAAMDKTKPE